MLRSYIPKIPGLAIAVQIAIGVVGLYFMVTTGVAQTPVEALPIWYWFFLLWLLVIQLPIAIFRSVAATLAGTSTIGRIALYRGILAIGWVVIAVAVSLWTPDKGGIIALLGTMGVANLIVLLVCIRRLGVRK